MTNPELSAVMIYAREPQRTADFYCRHFGLVSAGEIGGLIELRSAQGAPLLLIHRAAKSVKLGQVGVKLIFAVRDVEAFKQQSEAHGLVFGSTHEADGYVFANAKDQDGNPVQISSRAYRRID